MTKARRDQLLEIADALDAVWYAVKPLWGRYMMTPADAIRELVADVEGGILRDSLTAAIEAASPKQEPVRAAPSPTMTPDELVALATGVYL